MNYPSDPPKQPPDPSKQPRTACSEDYPFRSPPPVLQTSDSDQARFRFFDSAATSLKNVATRQPLVVILDDLHWADLPSLLLLQFLAPALRGMPLFGLGTYRDVEVDQKHPLAGALGALARHSQRVELQGLPATEVARLIEMTAGFAPSYIGIGAACILKKI